MLDWRNFRPSLIAGPVCLGLLAGCASQPLSAGQAGPGFLTGLFHGLIALFSLFGSLFFPVRMYAFPNSGFAYEFGFFLGLGLSNVALFLSAMTRIGGLLVRKS